ncbi:MAG: vitamin B12 dependent-methionine synthase activation domain-containing protein [Sarcina sp.]
MKNIIIDRDEVLRYLGYKGQEIDEALSNLLDESIKEVKEKVVPKVLFETYEIERKNDVINIIGTKLKLIGKDIASCLKNCDKVVLMAVTLGNEIERMIRLTQRRDMTKTVILDSIATTYVEAVCDKIEDEIYQECKKDGKSLSFRYSPGYGDLPLSVQGEFLDTLNARRLIGLNLTDTNLLIPRKSVTAILGIKNEESKRFKRTCENCLNYKTCKFRKEGVKCGD